MKSTILSTVVFVKTRLWPPVARTLTAPPTWFFAAVWLLSVAVLASRGFPGRAVQAPVVLLPVLLLSWLTVVMTEEPPPIVSATPSRTQLLVQTVVVGAVTLLVGLSAMSFWGVGPRAFASIPVWSGIFDRLLNLGASLPFPAPGAVSNPALELLLPLALLLLLGAGWRELGFGPGHRSVPVMLLWGVPQLAIIFIAVLSNQARPLNLLGAFIRNAFQNGPVEEFLFRGALQTRLSALLRGGWGLAITALVFGVWHIGTNARFETNGDLVSAACLGITNQAPFGIAFGVIFMRTRNLLAVSVIHMLVDLP